MPDVFTDHWRRWWDRLVAGLLAGGIILGPWAFGTTRPGAIAALTAIGWLMGGLWLLRPRDNFILSETPVQPGGRRLERWLGLLTLGVLGYQLLASWNARSAFDAASLGFTPRSYFAWLPHSFDQAASWQLLARTVGLAGVFWATRAWLLGARRHARSTTDTENFTGLLPSRPRRLLMFIVFNALVLTVVAVAQRLDGGGKLLWLAEPGINKTAASQFGPYAYRSNGLQYVALATPLAFGLWSMLTLAQRRTALFGSGRRLWLLIGGLVMATSPLFWQSRLAWLVALAVLGGSAIILTIVHGTRQVKFWIGAICTAALVASAVCLAWPGMGERLAADGMDSEGRRQLLETGWRMFQENWWFGAGPGSFVAMHQMYRLDTLDIWYAQMHCDWLETLATYGVAGTALWVTLLGALVAAPFAASARNHSVKGGTLAFIALSLTTALISGLLDFPFQVYSVQHLFVVIAAGYSTLAWRRH